MSNKRTLKKNSPKKSETKQPKLKTGQSSLMKKVSSTLPNSSYVIEPSNAEKMSEVLQDFASPLLIDLEDYNSIKSAISIATAVWNSSLLPDDEQKEAVGKIVSIIASPSDASNYAEVLNIVEMLLKRKEELYPHNKRFIHGFEFSMDGDDLRIDVASTL